MFALVIAAEFVIAPLIEDVMAETTSPSVPMLYVLIALYSVAAV